MIGEKGYLNTSLEMVDQPLAKPIQSNEGSLMPISSKPRTHCGGSHAVADVDLVGGGKKGLLNTAQFTVEPGCRP